MSDIASARREIKDLRTELSNKYQYVESQNWGDDDAGIAAKLGIMNKIKPIAAKLEEKEKEFREKYPGQKMEEE